MHKARKRLPLFLAGLALMAWPPGPARAEILYDNFGPGNSYQESGWAIGDIGMGLHQEIANPFTVTGGQFALASLDLALGHITGPNVYDVWLRADAGGLPGAVLETWHVANIVDFGSMNMPITVTSVLHPLLDPGATYWVAAAATDGTSGGWHWSPNDVGRFAFRTDPNDPWIDTVLIRSAYRVNGDPVPEPGTLALLGVGALGLVSYSWRRREQSA